MGRPPLEKKLGQIPVRLSDELRLRLTHSADARNVSLSQEIRERVERTFEKEDDVDPVTRELQAGIKNIAAIIQDTYGAAWHASSSANEAFHAAILYRITAYAPPPNSEPGPVTDLRLGTAEHPDVVGIVREADDRKTNDYPYLQLSQPVYLPKGGEENE
jgi:hypothetical protein